MYCRHRDWVVALSYRFTNDRDLALDVLQDTFLYFMKKFPGFQLTCPLRSFLYPVVKNLSLTALRKARRCQSDGSDLDELELLPATPVVGEAELDELAVVLNCLPREQREVLLLRFVNGLSLNEIADAMEIPLGTVKSRLHIALDRLRQDERTRKFFQE